MATIGQRVKSLRLSKRMTQIELAKRCGISQPSLAGIETGVTKSVKGETLDALARELSTTTTYLLRGVDSAEDHEHEMMAAEMAAIFRALPSDDKFTLLRLARGILPEKKAEKVR